MKKPVAILALLIIFILSINLTHNKLYQVVSLFRHGARYHLNSMYDGNSTQPMWGQLTAVGMRQHQNLGKIIKKQYIDNLAFLSPNYNKTQIDVYSTPYNRTIQSVMSQLYGIYPPGTGPRLTYVQRSYHIPPYSNKSDIDQQNYALPNAHQPIPVKFNGKLLLQNCLNYFKIINQNYQIKRAEYQSMLLNYQPFLTHIAEVFNISDADNFNFTQACRLFDTLTVDKFLGRPFPSGFTDDDFKNLQHLNYWRIFFEYSLNISSVLNSRKLQKVIDTFDARTLNTSGYPLKWTFLSAHDTHLAPMVTALNISSSTCIEELWRTGKTTALNCQVGPEFASNIFFQLHSDNAKDFYVKVRYNGKYVNLCTKTDVKCPYTDFKTRIKKLILSDSDIEKQCGNKIPQIPDQIIGFSEFYHMDLEKMNQYPKQFIKRVQKTKQLQEKQQIVLTE